MNKKTRKAIYKIQWVDEVKAALRTAAKFTKSCLWEFNPIIIILVQLKKMSTNCLKKCSTDTEKLSVHGGGSECKTFAKPD